MHTVLKNVLSVNDLDEIRELYSSVALIDGRATSSVVGKKNLQMPIGSDAATKAGAIVLEGLRKHDLFNMAVQPRYLNQPLFSTYEVGMEYPDHVDVAIMSELRTDVAITVFLMDKNTYDGGELVIDSREGICSYRLDAGDAIAYPASTIHHVAKVTRGVRSVAALWVQSTIRDPQQRLILLNLALSMRALGNTLVGPYVSRSYWNLLRRWADTAPAQTMDRFRA